MKLVVRVTAGVKVPSVTRNNENHLAISVKEKAKGNEANFAVIKALAEYLKIPQSRIRLVQGRTSRDKIFAIG